ncbi:MAG: nucleotidyltransferase domain-containing protein [Nanoarchaeota archaeon]
MLQNYNKYKVLKIFFDDPRPEGIGFQLREISRTINLAPKSVSLYLTELEREGFIIKRKHRIHGFPVYLANRDDENFKFYKKLDTIINIKESGLLKYLSENCMPDVIILFGSAARGEDLKGSDLDLFLLCKERKLDLKDFEMVIKRKINIFFTEEFSKLSAELKNNILSGIILKGYLEVF